MPSTPVPRSRRVVSEEITARGSARTYVPMKGPSMSGNRLRFLVVSALAALALVVAACGGSDSSSSTSSKTTAKPAGGGTPDTTAGKKGGKLTMLSSSDVDYLDPGHTYYTAGEQVDGAMGRTLYTIGPKDPGKTIPDIADGEPQISADKKTVTVKLKKGIKYSPPVNRE